ncbi:MAG: hypothetical protein ABSB09_10750 [Acidimicrobiales bacterium]
MAGEVAVDEATWSVAANGALAVAPAEGAAGAGAAAVDEDTCSAGTFVDGE